MLDLTSSDRDISKRTTYTLLLLVCLLGCFLRFYKINFQSLWLDELYTIIPTNPGNSIASLIEYCYRDQPPLFFLYCQLMFKIFGYNEVVGRLSSATVGLLAIPSVYLLAREFSNRPTSVFAALLVSINYFHIYYSQELRFYSLLFLLTTLSYLFFVRAFKNPKRVNFIFYVITSVALLYTHYYGLLVFGCQALTFLILLFGNVSKRFIISGIVSGLTVVLLFIPWLPTIFNDLNIESIWIKPPDPYFLVTYFYYYFGKDILTSLTLCMLVVLFAITAARSGLPSPKTSPLIFILVCWFGLSYLVPYIKSVVGTPVMHHRYTIISLPVWILFFSLGWNAITKANYKMIVATLLILFSICNLFLFRRHYDKIRKEQFREVSGLALKKNTMKLPMYSTLDWHFNYYFRNTDMQVLPLYYDKIESEQEFWLLQATPAEEGITTEINKLSEQFDLVEQYEFYKGNLILLRNKSIALP